MRWRDLDMIQLAERVLRELGVEVSVLQVEA
jgi:hypothetical protein